ncbi:MAG TPA: hypothetical protein VFI41_00095 [Gemmatimonadales bacterium]|nr:hypothetical protein [Gemmatimonadales bacterium]
MPTRISDIGYRAGLAACAAAVSYDVVQLLQVAGVLRFPLDEILIYGTSLCIVVPFVLEIVALHYLASGDQRYWSHASLVFTIMYAVFVTANYVVQLSSVIPAKLSGSTAGVGLLEQTPHSLFWDYDAIGYIAMGLATLLAIPALGQGGVERRARRALLANALVTPLISIVYFSPAYSTRLLFLGFPWAITAPLCMLMLALALRERAGP